MTEDEQRQNAAHAAHKREQARRALSMTMAERLAWLERTLDEMRALHGIARRARTVPDAIPDPPRDLGS